MSEVKYRRVIGKSFWSHVYAPNTKGKYPTNKYELTLVVSESTKNILEDLGVQVKDTDNGYTVMIRSTKRPRVEFSADTEIDSETAELDGVLIGNGSKVEVTFGLYDNRSANVKAGKGGLKSMSLVAVTVLKLVNFKPVSVPLINEDE